MLRNETIQKLKILRLSGFAEALQEQYESEQFDMLSFDERLGLLIDREHARRESNRLKRLISNAHFKNSQASIENLYYEPLRKLDRLDLALDGADAIDRGQMAHQHEVQAPIAAGGLDGEQVGRGFHHTHPLAVAARVATDDAQVLLGEVAAALAAAHLLGSADKCRGQAHGALAMALQQVQRHALGRLGADAGQTAQGVDQFIDNGPEHRTSSVNNSK